MNFGKFKKYGYHLVFGRSVTLKNSRCISQIVETNLFKIFFKVEQMNRIKDSINHTPCMHMTSSKKQILTLEMMKIQMRLIKAAVALMNTMVYDPVSAVP